MYVLLLLFIFSFFSGIQCSYKKKSLNASKEINPEWDWDHFASNGPRIFWANQEKIQFLALGKSALWTNYFQAIVSHEKKLKFNDLETYFPEVYEKLKEKKSQHKKKHFAHLYLVQSVKTNFNWRNKLNEYEELKPEELKKVPQLLLEKVPNKVLAAGKKIAVGRVLEGERWIITIDRRKNIIAPAQLHELKRPYHPKEKHKENI